MTVYDEFVELASKLLQQCDDTEKRAILEGVRAHLKRKGVLDETNDAERLANREWIRFRGISKDSFCAYFENYEARQRVKDFSDECAVAAVARVKHHICLSKEEYTARLSAFFGLAADLVGDKRYTAWLEDLTDRVTKDLQFASGQNDSVRREIIERSQFA